MTSSNEGLMHAAFLILLGLGTYENQIGLPKSLPNCEVTSTANKQRKYCPTPSSHDNKIDALAEECMAIGMSSGVLHRDDRAGEHSPVCQTVSPWVISVFR